MENKNAVEQFADDFLLVAMNDQFTYNYFMEVVKGYEMHEYNIAEELWDGYETTMSEMIGSGDTVDKLIARQLLLTWGIQPFHHIARYLIERYKENQEVA